MGESCLISSREIISFGANPVSGGRPPSDSKVSIAIMVSTGVLGHDVESWDIFVVFRANKVINMADVIIIYKIKLNIVR